MTIENIEHRRIIFRAWHRGIKEMDYILGKYVDSKISSLSEQDIYDLQYIMSFSDRELYSWFIGEVMPPEEVCLPVFYDIKQFHNL